MGQEALAILDRILKKLGNWPVFENDKWKESNFDWIDFTIGSKKIGLDINYFLDLKPWRLVESNKPSIRYLIDVRIHHSLIYYFVKNFFFIRKRDFFFL